MKNIFFLFIFLLAISSCNKEKRFSNRLMAGETWELKSITVDGAEQELLGKWQFLKGGDIYDSVQEANWLVRKVINFYGLGPLSATGADKYWQPSVNKTDSILSQFNWQFSNKGKTFKFRYKQLCEECNSYYLSEYDYFAHNITGDYKVKKHKKEEMIFESNQTNGFSGKKVVIIINKYKIIN